MSETQTGGVTTRRPAGHSGSAVGPRAGGQVRGDAPDLVSIYAERLRAAEGAPPLFAEQPVVRIGRGTPGFRRRRPGPPAGRRPAGERSSSRLTRRNRLAVAAAVVAAIVTTALAGTVLAG